MRASANTKVTWTLTVLFLLLFLSGVVLIMMISTVRRGKREKPENNFIASLNAAWGEPLPIQLEVVQVAPSPQGATMKETGPAVTVVKVRMNEADTHRVIQSGQVLAKVPGVQPLSLNVEEVLSFWYVLASQLPPHVDESQVFMANPEGALAAPVREAVEGWLAGPGVEAYRHGANWFAVDKKNRPWELYLVVKKK